MPWEYRYRYWWVLRFFILRRIGYISKNAVKQKTKSEKLHINFEVIGDETTVIKSPSWSLEVVLSIWWVKEEAKPNGKLTLCQNLSAQS